MCSCTSQERASDAPATGGARVAEVAEGVREPEVREVQAVLDDEGDAVADVMAGGAPHDGGQQQQEEVVPQRLADGPARAAAEARHATRSLPRGVIQRHLLPFEEW